MPGSNDTPYLLKTKRDTTAVKALFSRVGDKGHGLDKRDRVLFVDSKIGPCEKAKRDGSLCYLGDIMSFIDHHIAGSETDQTYARDLFFRIAGFVLQGKGAVCSLSTSVHATEPEDMVQFTAGMAYPWCLAWFITSMKSWPVTTPVLSVVGTDTAALVTTDLFVVVDFLEIEEETFVCANAALCARAEKADIVITCVLTRVR